MDFSSPSKSHIPHTIYPIVPESRRAASAPGPLPKAKPPHSRRFTTVHIPARREARPLRSSPLAGPSLTHDDALKEPGPSRQNPRRHTLIHTTSAPEVPTRTLITDIIVQSPVDDLNSPTNSSDGGHTLSAPELHATGHSEEPLAKDSRLRRLSLKLRRRSVQAPPLPLDNNAAGNHSPPASPRTCAPTTAISAPPPQDTAPPVPDLPFWARASRRQSPARVARPSTAPTTPSPSQAPRGRTAAAEAHIVPPVPLQNFNLPSTSRDPEQNWLSTASAPRFSRLGLKAEGVVLPVSLKEARRRSTVSLSSRTSSEGKSLKGKPSTRSLRSVGGETAKRLTEFAAMPPPCPPFRSDANASSSSLASSTLGSTLEPDAAAAETADGSGSYVDGLPAVPKIGSPYGLQNRSASTVELVLRVNDVTVDIIGYNEQEDAVEVPRESSEPAIAAERAVPMEAAPHVEVQPQKTGLGRRRTLKQVWKRVFKTVAG